MQTMNTLAGCACSIASSLVLVVPAFAQSNTVAQLESSAVPAHLTTAMLVYTPVRGDDTPRPSMPANLEVPAGYRELVERMLDRSPTYRRQCMRLSAARHLTVRVRSESSRGREAPRAYTQISREEDGRLIARVSLTAGSSNPAELIAHELEHIVEQLDGIDLAHRSALQGSGVRAGRDGSFETLRAQRIGRLVAREAERER